MAKLMINMDQMAENAAAASSLMKQLSNQNRLMILCTLLEAEVSVSELNQMIPLSQSALSQHLSSLREAGLVATRRESQTIYYRLKGDHAQQVIEVLHKIYCPQP
ncbi:MAG: DNA-binding transcriptional ArsR family regulator [Candidatus Azotimanducaceae bacterium]|jgi:DNA-binding transcriptional ArsR family regulator